MDIIRLIIADDHIIFRKGLRTILNELDEIKVVGEASNGHELLDQLKNQKADVVLMDIRMPVMDGIEATKKVSDHYPDVKVIALTMHEEIGYFNQMVEAGASGFLLKKTTRDELQKAIQMVIEGENYFSEEFISHAQTFQKPRQKNPMIQLTDREEEVLSYICKGYSNAEIGKHLGVSIRTVDGHRARLLEKTGAKNSPHLVMFAIKNGLIKA